MIPQNKADSKRAAAEEEAKRLAEARASYKELLNQQDSIGPCPIKARGEYCPICDAKETR